VLPRSRWVASSGVDVSCMRHCGRRSGSVKAPATGTVCKLCSASCCARDPSPIVDAETERMGVPTTEPPSLETGEPSCKDEARIGQKNGLVRQWARRGTRPRQPADQRYDNAYLFGGICPARGVGAALALPYADTDMMQLHLDEISRNVAEGATPSCCSIAPDGIRHASSTCPKTSPRSSCPHAPQS
jgi:hypothetical protein